MKYGLVAVALIVATATRAHGQPGEPLPPLQPASQAASPLYRGSPKSPLLAGTLSLGLTVAGIGLSVMAKDIAPHYDEPGKSDALRVGVVATGAVLLLVGPTSGHLYAGQAWNSGLKWRLIGGAVFAACIVPAFAFGFSDNPAGASIFGLLATGGGIIYIGATIWEIGTAPGAARRHNERLEEASISIAPIIGREPGLAIAGRF